MFSHDLTHCLIMMLINFDKNLDLCVDFSGLEIHLQFPKVNVGRVQPCSMFCHDSTKVQVSGVFYILLGDSTFLTFCQSA